MTKRKSKGKRGSTADFEFGEWPFLDGVPSADAADAARYRWLMKDDGHNALMATLASLCANDGPIKPQMDAAIDAAMKFG